MAFSFRHLIVAIVCVVSLVAVRAQVAPAPEKEVSLQFSVFALGGAEGIGYLSKSDKTPRALKFYSAYRSPQYAYKGGSRISFYATTSTTAADAAPVAVYDIPEGAGNLLLLFFPKETPTADGLRFDVYGVDDSVGRTPAGHFTTINVSGREYVGQYAGSRINIPRGVGEVHAGKGRVSLVLAAQVEGHWMPSGKHEFTMAAQDRVMLVFYPSASHTGIYPIIRRLTDTLPAAERTGPSVAQYP